MSERREGDDSFLLTDFDGSFLFDDEVNRIVFKSLAEEEYL